MFGLITHFATFDNTPPPTEVKYLNTQNAYRSALTALHLAKQNPDADAADIMELENMVMDFEAMLRSLEPLRPAMSVGLVTGMVTWGTSELTM